MKLTVKEVATEIGETAAVIRNWLRDFKTLIPTEKGENGYNLFGPEAVTVLRTIQRLHREQGYTTRQIEHFLASGGEVAAVAEQSPAPVDERMDNVVTMLQALMERQEQNEQLQRQILQRMDERDRVLTEYITEQRTKRTLIESSVNPPKRKLSLWERWRKPKR